MNFIIKKIVIAFFSLLGYRQSLPYFPQKRSEIAVNSVILFLFIIYYGFTMRSIRYDEISNLSFFCWFISMTITSVDNFKRLLNGTNRYEKLQNKKHPPKRSRTSPPKQYKFNNRIYIYMLRLEVVLLVPVFIIHIGSFNSSLLGAERCWMYFSTIVFMIQSLVHGTADLLNLDDIEEIK